MSELLLEVGVEEIPDWMIEPALEELRVAIGHNAQVFGTPRRLVVYVADLPEAQADTQEQLTGPPKKAPQQAAEAFAKKCGVAIGKLETITTPKGEYWSYLKKEKGQKTIDVLKLSLPAAVTGIHWPKTMYWTGKGAVRFIRPIRSILALFGGKIVKFDIAGVKAGDTTFGHRVLGKSKIKVTNFESYKTALRENGVILDAAERRARILASGVKVRPNVELVDTLVYLTEFPTTGIGEFDPSYLTLPEEVLSTVMAHHQKYLSVETEKGTLAPKFVFVMNRGADESGIVRHGNERVLRARFNDARFFWDTDQKFRLDQRTEMLEKVTFHAKLGSYAEKTRRVQKLARAIAPDLNAEEAQVARAAELCKCDLTTELVKEFTELQGKIGGLYARHQHEGEKVAQAIYDHYLPESVDDRIPRTPEGAALAVADKLDTLVSCFRIGLRPSGSRDPLALRRAAQGVMLIMTAREYASVQLERHAQQASFDAQTPEMDPRELVDSLIEFFNERVRSLLERAFTYDVANAVMHKGPFVTRPYDAGERAKAIVKLRQSPDFDPFIAGYKRIKNILVKAGRPIDGSLSYPDPQLMEDGPERMLWEAAEKVHRELTESGGDNPDYSTVLGRMPELRPHIDLFFDKVMVMADDERIRRNRLALLAFTIYHFARIADFSEIVTSKEKE